MNKTQAEQVLVNLAQQSRQNIVNQINALHKELAIIDESIKAMSGEADKEVVDNTKKDKVLTKEEAQALVDSGEIEDIDDVEYKVELTPEQLKEAEEEKKRLQKERKERNEKLKGKPKAIGFKQVGR